MSRWAPKKFDPHEIHGLGLDSVCQYCGVHMMEIETDPYVGAKGWMCEACFFGDTKPHCLPRPYAKLRQRKG